jgi:hypothetical protein
MKCLSYDRDRQGWLANDQIESPPGGRVAACRDLFAPELTGRSEFRNQLVPIDNRAVRGATELADNWSCVTEAIGRECREICVEICQQARRDRNGHPLSNPAPAQHRMHKGTANASVAIDEWMDRLELSMRNSRLGQWCDVVAVAERHEIVQGLFYLRMVRRHEHRPMRTEVAAADPHLRRSQLSCSPIVEFYSHSMVAGGLLVRSSVMRLTSGTSLVMRVEIFSSRSYGRRPQSAVIASSLVTGRSTIG